MSTAGTTASVCFIKRGKIFVGHCGDSGIILGQEDPKHPGQWRAKPLTVDHKPEAEEELRRITDAGGKVVVKSGVPRVVWKRPKDRSHSGPIRRSTAIDEIPFLAVARALGDLWSYNAADDVFVVSPDPDLFVYEIDVLRDRCLVLATDGAWNVLTAEDAIDVVHNTEVGVKKARNDLFA
jgi:protein phosphatase 1D